MAWCKRRGVGVWITKFWVMVVALAWGCSAASGERLERDIYQSGLMRGYIAHLPPDVASRDAWPVLIALHPGFASARDFERITQFHTTDGYENFVVVYPNGFRRSWNVGNCCGSAKAQQVDDIGFIQSIMDDLSTIVPIERRAYLTGFSNGAMLIYRIICDNAEMVAAAAPSGAIISVDRSTCAPSRKVPILHIHGELDEHAPFQGGMSRHKRVGVQPSIVDGVAYFAQRNRCGAASNSVLIKDVHCTQWTGCAGRSDVSVCLVPGLGHLWPGGKSGALGSMMRLGPPRTDVSASAVIIEYFLRNSKS